MRRIFAQPLASHGKFRNSPVAPAIRGFFSGVCNMKSFVSAAVIAAFCSTSVIAQVPAATPAIAPAPAAEPVVQPAVATTPEMVSVAPVAQTVVLGEGTQILLAVSQEINSTQNRVGDTFPLTVAQDVRVGDTIVIPRGTRGVGEITWRTGRGAFGKSGKMEFSIRHLDVDGVRVPVIGSFRQEGDGATLATIGAVAIAGLIGGAFVTGSRARVPAGRELTVTLAAATPFVATGTEVSLDPAYTPPTAEQVAAVETAQRRASAEVSCRETADSRAGTQAQRDRRIARCVERAVRVRS